MRRSGSSQPINSTPVRRSSQGMAVPIAQSRICGSASIRVMIWRSIIGTRIISASTTSSTMRMKTRVTAMLRERPARSMRSTSGSPSQASRSASTNGVRIGDSSDTTHSTPTITAAHLRRRRNWAISASGVRII